MPMISEHVKMLILFGSFCNDHYCLFLVIIEKHAPHSRYFSDELGALFIYNNIEHMFTYLVTYGIIFIWKLNAILNSRMQELIPYVLNLVLHIYLRY